MNDVIKQHLIKVAEANKWGTGDKELFEILLESKPIHKEIVGSHRWYDDQFKVVEVDGLLIGFYDFYMTGDNNADDMGLEHDYDSVCLVEKTQKIIDVYTPVS